MKAKWKIGILSVCMACLLTGCGDDEALANATDEELDNVGEYAAITLLKYDARTRSRLVTLPDETEESVEGENPEESAAAESGATEENGEAQSGEDGAAGSDMTVVDATEPAFSSIEEFLGLPEGVTVAFAGQELCESYTDATIDYLSIDASEGKQLVAANFVIVNNSEQEQTIDILSMDVSFRLIVNEDYTRTALTTMLTNDFANYQGTLAAGESREVVVLIEVSPDQVETINSLSLYLKNASNAYTIQLI